MPECHWALQAIGWVIAAAITVAGALAVIVVLGMAVESVGKYQEDKEICLKQSSNAYEAQRC